MKQTYLIKQDFTDHIQIERNIYVHYHEWYNDIKSSYKNNDNIFKQFEMDFQRSILYCNGHIVNNTDVWLKEGDVVRLDIEHLGSLENKIILLK